MTGARIGRDGRKTFKGKPGPKRENAADSGDRDDLIFLHALDRHGEFRQLFPKVEHGGRSRDFARVAIAIVEGDAIDDRAGAFITTEKLASAADTLLKKHRQIMRDRTRKEDRAFLDRCADLLFEAARPKRAALPKHPILATPEGIFGAGAWSTKRIAKEAAAQAVRGEPSWVTASRLGVLAELDGANESRRLAQRARDDLKAIAFPIDEVLERLNLLQHYELKAKSQN